MSSEILHIEEGGREREKREREEREGEREKVHSWEIMSRRCDLSIVVSLFSNY